MPSTALRAAVHLAVLGCAAAVIHTAGGAAQRAPGTQHAASTVPQVTHDASSSRLESAGDVGTALQATATAPRLHSSRTNASEIVTTDDEGRDGLCDLAEGFFQTVVRSTCQTSSQAITCVYVKYPRCSTEDICSRRNGCGFVEDNSFVKFTGYTCKGTVGFSGGKPTGDFQLDCSPALTPLATGLIVVLCVLVVASCACFLWCCCCR
mmetsp:Transcript_2685/g.8339  ORF Transcript_2685/g.8339 Transcript_2685/m.8339 type:complete len:208 (+) Transcript_2685:96-719(+)